VSDLTRAIAMGIDQRMSDMVQQVVTMPLLNYY